MTRAMKTTKTLLIFSSIFFSSVSFAAEKPDVTKKYKSGGPIEITSDSLEVLQQKQQAIFTGHVIAVQGDVHLKSEKMTVFYKNTETAGKAPKKEEKENPLTSAVGDKNSIDKIIVEKNVFLTTPEETARGAHGLYDVVNHKIYLNDNVVLTRDKNVLKGDKLVYDFETGKSEMNTVQSGTPGKRVKALFVSDNNKDNKPTTGNAAQKAPDKK